MIKGLYLCGTVHLDLAGPERLRKVLDTVKPDCVAVESYPALSQEILEKRKEIVEMTEQTLLQRLKDKSKVPIDGVRTDSALALLNCAGYEIWVPHEYADKTGAQIAHIEDEGRSKRISNGFLENILSDPKKTEPFIEMLKLSPKTLRNIFDFCYELGAQRDNDICEVAERNKVFAERISQLDGRVLAVTGAGHIYGAEPTLQTLLKGYNPTSFKLAQADYFDSDKRNRITLTEQ